MESFLGKILRDNFSNFVIYADRIYVFSDTKAKNNRGPMFSLVQIFFV